MHDIPYGSLLESDDPSALVLAILCDFEERDKQEVVNTILTKLRQLCNDREFANHLGMINVLADSRDLENEVEKGVEMLTVEIEKTPFYKIGKKRGEMKAALKHAAMVM